MEWAAIVEKSAGPWRKKLTFQDFWGKNRDGVLKKTSGDFSLSISFEAEKKCPVSHDRKSVVCPIIDVISDETFEYITGSDMTWGGFNWKLNFRWYPVPQREMERRGGDRSLPLR